MEKHGVAAASIMISRLRLWFLGDLSSLFLFAFGSLDPVRQLLEMYPRHSHGQRISAHPNSDPIGADKFVRCPGYFRVFLRYFFWNFLRPPPFRDHRRHSWRGYRWNFGIYRWPPAPAFHAG